MLGMAEQRAGESINEECFPLCFSPDEAVWSAGLCASCVGMRDQHQNISMTHRKALRHNE